MINLDIHPCFNAKVKGQFGRVHLPVAPKCNILCNYCNRKFDCVNESRPGVTSSVLSPTQAIAYLERVLEAEPRITVAGIAGPGDPFANPKETHGDPAADPPTVSGALALPGQQRPGDRALPG